MHLAEKSAIINCVVKRRVSTSVVHRLPKPRRRVRFPYPAPEENRRNLMVSEVFLDFFSRIAFASDGCGTLWKLECSLSSQAALQNIPLCLLDLAVPPLHNYCTLDGSLIRNFSIEILYPDTFCPLSTIYYNYPLSFQWGK